MNKLQKILCIGAGVLTLGLTTCLNNLEASQTSESLKNSDYTLKKIYIAKEDFKKDGEKEWGFVIEEPGKYRKVYYFN